MSHKISADFSLSQKHTSSKALQGRVKKENLHAIRAGYKEFSKSIRKFRLYDR